MLSTRSASPATSTTTGGGPSGVSGSAVSPSAFSASALPVSSPTSPPSLPSGLSDPSPGGRPAVSGANGDGVSAASTTRYGRDPYGNDRSKKCASYTGSKTRADMNARYLPSRVKA